MNQNQQNQQYNQYQQRVPQKSGMPVWAVVLIVFVIVGFLGFIMLGILAAVAAPKLSYNIQTARCREIPRTFDQISNTMNTYINETDSAITLTTEEEFKNLLGVDFSSNGGYFAYRVEANGRDYTITAESLRQLGIVAAGDKVWVNQHGKADTDSEGFKKYLSKYLLESQNKLYHTDMEEL